MSDVKMPKISAEMKYSDIIVPTMDLVRGSFLVHLLATNKKKVCVSYVYSILSDLSINPIFKTMLAWNETGKR